MKTISLKQWYLDIYSSSLISVNDLRRDPDQLVNGFENSDFSEVILIYLSLMPALNVFVDNYFYIL